MNWQRRLKYIFYKWMPRKHKFRGSWVHKFLGERIFDKELWLFKKRNMAAGFALGTFIAFSPTFPFQMTLAIIGCLVLRVNIPLAILAVWITNPLTIPLIFTLEYKLGANIMHLIDLPNVKDFSASHSPLNQLQIASPNLQHHVLQTMGRITNLMIGSLIFSTLFSAIAYLLIYWTGDWLEKHLTRPVHKTNRKGKL